MTMTLYICTGGSEGRAVIAGYADERPTPGQVSTLTSARMVLFWAADTGGLFGLAATGPTPSCRLSGTAPAVTDAWKQVLDVSPAAEARILAHPVWVG